MFQKRKFKQGFVCLLDKNDRITFFFTRRSTLFRAYFVNL